MRTPYALPVRFVSKRVFRSGLPLALLCALGMGTLPLTARAQQPTPLPALNGLPLVSTLFVLPQDASLGRETLAQSNRSFDPSALVSIDAKNANLATLIDLLMEQAHASYTLSQTLTTAPVGNVKLRKVPFQAALDAILKMSDVAVTYRVETGIFRIIPRSDVEARPTATAATAANAADAGNMFYLGVQAGAAANDKRSPVVSVNLSNITLYAALKLVFEQAHVNYTLDPALRNISVSAALTNVPLRIAVNTLLKTTGKNDLTFRVENGIYRVDATGENAAPAIKP